MVVPCKHGSKLSLDQDRTYAFETIIQRSEYQGFQNAETRNSFHLFLIVAILRMISLVRFFNSAEGCSNFRPTR